MNWEFKIKKKKIKTYASYRNLNLKKARYTSVVGIGTEKYTIGRTYRVKL